MRISLGGARRQARHEPRPAHRVDDLERHIARCRRSGSAAALLVARTTPGTVLALSLEASLRLTDSAICSDASELVLLCDEPAPDHHAPGLDRHALERRIGELAGVRLLCTWASFPADGLSVEDLLHHARAAVAAAPAIVTPDELVGGAALHRLVGAR